MRTFTYCIHDELGLHARTAGMLAALAEDYQSMIVIDDGRKRENVKRLMAVMSMRIKKGQTVTVFVEGADEDTAAAAIETFFRTNL